MPAHNPPPVRLTDVSHAKCKGAPHECDTWTVFTHVRIIPRLSELTLTVLRDVRTGQEVISPRIYESPYPAIVMIEEDYECFQRFETYDTDPFRIVEKGFVALKVKGLPDAKVPVHLVSPAQCHAHELGYAVV